MSSLARPIEASSSLTETRRCLLAGLAGLIASSLVEPDRDRARMSGETFGLAERDRGGTQRAQLIRAAFEQRRALHEVEHAQTRREARRTRRRQHVIGARDVISNGFRRMRTNEDGAGIADL